MKIKLLFLTLLTCVLSFAQQSGAVALNWVDNANLSVGDIKLVIPSFQPEYMDYRHGDKQLFFNYRFKVSGPVDEKSLVINNVVYETVTRQQLGELEETAVPQSLNAGIVSVKARDEYFASIVFSPVVKQGGVFKRVKSFSYSYILGGMPMRNFGIEEFNQITNSVLASGDWYRFYVEKSGVYKISRSFLQQLGMDTNADPRNIKIYGHGGKMVPLRNSESYPADLTENAITFIGEPDGRFDSGDYILFYAEGVDNWSGENASHNNLYADRAYYYVTAQGGPGKRIAEAGQPTAVPVAATGVVDNYLYHEKDLINIGRVGKRWHGEAFSVNNRQQFEFTLDDYDPSPLSITIRAAASSVTQTTMKATANGQDLGTLSFRVPADLALAYEGETTAFARNGLTASYTPSATTLKIELTYNNAGAPGSNAWLDYITVSSKRKLNGNGRQFRFQYDAAAGINGIVQYNVSNASAISEIWDVTDIYNVSKVTNASLQSQFSFKAAGGEVRKYITVVPNDYYSPLRESQSRVANQNIKGTIFNAANGQFQDIDYLIVTPASLNAPAARLAEVHRKDGLNVKVVNLENIYQEFSSGKQDPGAIRNLVKYIYHNASSADRKIKYVNLFGDASFDFKNRIPNNTNVVPIMHSNDASYSVVSTYVTDDFYGLMDANEGGVAASLTGIDVAIGRMLVNDRKQADEMVNKVIEYKSPEAYGRWRNEFIALTDDLDGTGSELFNDKMEEITGQLKTARPFVNIRKFYADAYVQQASAGGQRYPDAKEQFIRAINYGALVVNYLGHGGEDGMSGERLYEKNDADNLTNQYKYPLFITASCEVTKFDNPYRPTVGEYTYWNPKGGAIAMISTARAMFIIDAYAFNPRVLQALYAYGESEYPSMAEAMRRAKNLGGASISMVCFIGDPALKFAVPKPEIQLTTINDTPVADFTGALSSLSYVKLGGRVVNESGNTMANYNGELEMTVFDKDVNKTTLGNDGVLVNGVLKITPFVALGETIFRGNASVANGQFEIGFVVPRDIRIPVANGRISFYSKKANSLEDYQGYNTSVRVGGVNPDAAADNTPPKVRLYMNDESFVSGGITNASPILLAFLEDEHGINTASGIGHDIVGVLDGDESNPFIMNDYYEADTDNFRKGALRFPFSNLAKGLHTLTFKAWDVYNNLVTAEIQFVVVGDEGLSLDKVLNYPNPFVSYTEFWFSHNRPFEPLDVQVQIFTVTGKVVKTINQSVTTDGFLCRDIRWDGKDDFGDRIGKGVYVYKLTVKSTVTNKTAEKYEKLVLL